MDGDATVLLKSLYVRYFLKQEDETDGKQAQKGRLLANDDSGYLNDDGIRKLLDPLAEMCGSTVVFVSLTTEGTPSDEYQTKCVQHLLNCVYKLKKKREEVTNFDRLLIPISWGNIHWTLAAVSVRVGVDTQTTTYKVSHYDSLGNDPAKKKKLQTIFNLLFNENAFEIEQMQVPTQVDGYNCGVYVCMYAIFHVVGYRLADQNDTNGVNTIWTNVMSTIREAIVGSRDKNPPNAKKFIIFNRIFHTNLVTSVIKVIESVHGGNTPSMFTLADVWNTTHRQIKKTADGKYVMGPSTFTNPYSATQKPIILTASNYPEFIQAPYSLAEVALADEAVRKEIFQKIGSTTFPQLFYLKITKNGDRFELSDKKKMVNMNTEIPLFLEEKMRQHFDTASYVVWGLKNVVEEFLNHNKTVNPAAEIIQIEDSGLDSEDSYLTFEGVQGKHEEERWVTYFSRLMGQNEVSNSILSEVTAIAEMREVLNKSEEKFYVNFFVEHVNDTHSRALHSFKTNVLEEVSNDKLWVDLFYEWGVGDNEWLEKTVKKDNFNAVFIALQSQPPNYRHSLRTFFSSYKGDDVLINFYKDKIVNQDIIVQDDTFGIIKEEIVKDIGKLSEGTVQNELMSRLNGIDGMLWEDDLKRLTNDITHLSQLNTFNKLKKKLEDIQSEYEPLKSEIAEMLKETLKEGTEEHVICKYYNRVKRYQDMARLVNTLMTGKTFNDLGDEGNTILDKIMEYELKECEENESYTIFDFEKSNETDNMENNDYDTLKTTIERYNNNHDNNDAEEIDAEEIDAETPSAQRVLNAGTVWNGLHAIASGVDAALGLGASARHDDPVLFEANEWLREA